MSMAAGEYVSVSSQADTEHADVNRERSELATDTAAERKELTQIYVRRGLDRETAESVARQLMVRDALGAHTRDELGILEMTTARPIQAALTSAATFTGGAALPLLIVFVAPMLLLVPSEAAQPLHFLPLHGQPGPMRAGPPPWRPPARVSS